MSVGVAVRYPPRGLEIGDIEAIMMKTMNMSSPGQALGRICPAIIAAKTQALVTNSITYICTSLGSRCTIVARTAKEKAEPRLDTFVSAKGSKDQSHQAPIHHQASPPPLRKWIPLAMPTIRLKGTRASNLARLHLPLYPAVEWPS
jgi:hypothetical protein